MEHSCPPKLYLQVDNCTKEGKNKAVLIFCAHLVHFGWFKEVEVCSLVPGHTHDKIDQLFSNWSKHEVNHSILSPNGLDTFLKGSYKTVKTTFSLIRKVFDWKSLLLANSAELKGYGKAKLFRLLKDNSNVVKLWWKTNSADSWHGFQPPDSTEECGILLTRQYVSCSPQLLPPLLLDKDIVANLAT